MVHGSVLNKVQLQKEVQASLPQLKSKDIKQFLSTYCVRGVRASSSTTAAAAGVGGAVATNSSKRKS